MKKHNIEVTVSAKQDLLDIFYYICRYDGSVNAKKLINILTNKIKSLAITPSCGSFPAELLELGFKLFREIYHGPYRIIYQINSPKVIIMAIVDGRRDLSTFLENRLLHRNIS